MRERTIYISNPKVKTQVKRRKKYISKTVKYYILQKSVGIFMIIIGIISTVITGDGTALVMLLFCGLPLIFSKKKMLTISEYKNSKYSGKFNSNRRNF